MYSMVFARLVFVNSYCVFTEFFLLDPSGNNSFLLKLIVGTKLLFPVTVKLRRCSDVIRLVGIVLLKVV